MGNQIWPGFTRSKLSSKLLEFFYKKGYFFHHLKSWLQIVWSMILINTLPSLIAPFLILKKTHTLYIVESQLTRNLITFSIIKKPIIPIWLKSHVICIQFQLCPPKANVCLVVINCLLRIGEPEWMKDDIMKASEYLKAWDNIEFYIY